MLGLATGQTLNSRGWNYLKRGAWLMCLALVIKGESFFVPTVTDLHQRKLYKRAPSIYESFCEKLRDVLCSWEKEKEIQKMNSAISHLNLLVTFQETWLVTPPLCSFHLPKCPRLGWQLGKKTTTKKKNRVAMANSCCGLGVHKV